MNVNQQVESLFLAASELDPSERAAFLDSQCGEDSTLRGEVERLLEQDVDGFLDGPSADAGRSGSRTRREWIGKEIGPYVVREVLGRGGMGAVYLADRRGGFSQRVAIKVLRGLGAPKRMAQQFQRECKTQGELGEHPNMSWRCWTPIVESDGACCLVMEYVDGLPIDAYCNEHGSSQFHSDSSYFVTSATPSPTRTATWFSIAT